MTIHEEKARENFLAGYNCAQSVFRAFTDVTGLDENAAAALSAPFGAGFGRARELCGALSGIGLVLGVLYGGYTPEDRASKTAMYQRTQYFTKRFIAEYGSFKCHVILGKPEGIEDPKPELHTREYILSRPCIGCVSFAARILDEYLAARRLEPELVRAGMDDCAELLRLQKAAFLPLYEKYHDTATSPATEDIGRIEARMAQPFTDYYFIRLEGRNIGGIRIVRQEDGGCRISPVFVVPEYQDRGYARKALLACERLYPGAKRWRLDTIAEEEKLCRFYERLGYCRTGREEAIQEGMTIVYYEKNIPSCAF